MHQVSLVIVDVTREHHVPQTVGQEPVGARPAQTKSATEVGLDDARRER